ncbi:MAG: hypothetical protein IPO99_18100 [Nitrospira sp.]|nr:hypothetical protein [Nitrospira sp.]
MVKEEDTRFVGAIRRTYLAVLQWALRLALKVIGAALLLLVRHSGRYCSSVEKFMPALEEGNLWVRATMPVDISYDEPPADRRNPADVPAVAEVITIVCLQLGRPDDGIRPTSFFNAGFSQI